MDTRTALIPVLLAAASFGASGQSVPSYLQSHYPAAGATGVPTNTKIIVNGSVTAVSFSLKTQAGAAVSLGSPDVFFPSAALTPTAPLSPATQYIFTVTPSPSIIGAPYSFSFTTGAGPDITPPHVTGFSPASGTTGVGLQDAFTVLFDKRLLDVSVIRGNGISMVAPGGGGGVTSTTTITADGTGVIVRPLPNQWPGGLQLTVDPAKILDASGNAGTGAVQVAHYATFLTTDFSGPILRTFFPADGAKDLPVNVSIRLLFDRAVDMTTAATGIQLTSNGTAVKVSYNPFASGFGIELKPQSLLAPNQTFQVTAGPGLQDFAAIPAGQTWSYQFSTAANPDGVAPQWVDLQPKSGDIGVPLNASLSLRTNKAIMPIAAVEYSSFNGPDKPAATASISADGMTFTLTPAAPFAPLTQYSANLTDLVDITGTPFYTSNSGFTTGTDADSTPPSVLAVEPPDGIQDVPVKAPIQVLFSERPGAAQSADYIRLSNGGQTVPATLIFNGPQLTITPSASLAPGVTYTVEMNSVTDAAGNAMPPFSSSFTTAGAPGNPVGVRLLSSSPGSGDQDVDVNTPISFTFDSPLSPLAAFNGFTIGDAAETAYPATAVVSGNTITITPLHPLLANASLSASINTTDVSGNYVNARVQFRTAGNPDNAPFQVTSAAPADGSAISGPTRSITLTFNKAVNAASITSNTLTAWSNGALVSVKTLRTNNDLSVVVTPSLDSGDLILVASSDVMDVAGNPLAPFTGHYTFVPQNTSIWSPLAIRPVSGATGVPADTAITWFLTSPITLAAAKASIVVAADGSPVTGQLWLSPDGLILVFQPDTPFAGGAQVRVLDRNQVLGSTPQASFKIVELPAPQVTFLRSTPVTTLGVPANSVMEVEFSGDVTPAQNLVTLHLPALSPGGQGALVPTNASNPRPHVIRLTPVSPLIPGDYFIYVVPPVSSVVGGIQYIYVKLTPAVAVTEQAPVVGPQPGSVGTPVNASIRAVFPFPLDPLSVTADAVQIQSGGVPLSSQLYLTGDNRGLVATPTRILPANAQIDVSFSGLLDTYGNPIPDKSWSFVSGGTADFSPVLLISSTIPQPLNGAYPEIQPNETIALSFNKPLDPHSAVQNNINYLPPYDMRLSDDLQTIYMTPNPPLPVGKQYYLYLPQIADLSGNSYNLPATTFNVAFAAETSTPHILAVSPADGQSDLPLNTQILAAFDRTLSATSLGQVRIVRGDASLTGDSVPVAVKQSDLLHLRFVPARPLDANTTYTAVVEGVADMTGNVTTDRVVHTFTTGSRLDTTGPSAQFLASGAPGLPIQVLFSEPVSPATVDSQTIGMTVAVGNGSYATPFVSSVTLSADGRTATVTPPTALTTGSSYGIVLNGVRDFAGNAMSPSAGGSFTALAAADTVAPLGVITPPDGANPVPQGARLGVDFNETLGAGGPLSMQLTTGGQTVPGKVVQSGSSFTFQPDLPLATGTTYRLDAGSVADLSGNLSAPLSTTFTTQGASSPFVTQFQLLSISPASGAVGVASDAPLVLTFNEPVNPAAIPNGVYIISGFPLRGSWSFSGNTATFTPADLWPSAASVTVYPLPNGIRDLLGRTLAFNAGVVFKTVAYSDPDPPQLVSISPPAGTLLTPPTATFTLTFSKVVGFSTDSLTSFSGRSSTAISPSYRTSDYRTVSFTAGFDVNTTFTIAGSSTIVDRSGNAIAPFTIQYPTAAYSVSGRPTVKSVSPGQGATGVSASTPISLQFDRPMDTGSLLQNIHVTQDGVSITGQLTFDDSGQTAVFTPDQPYNAGSRIDVFVLETAVDASGLSIYQRFDAFFTVATAPAAHAVTVVSFGKAVIPSAGLELAIDGDIDPTTVSTDNVWLRTGQTAIAGAVTLPGARVLRFTPAAPLEPGMSYVLTVGAGLRGRDGTATRPEEFAFRVEPGVVAVPAAAAESVACEGSEVHVHFTAPVSPVAAGRALLTGPDGVAIPVSRRISADFRDLWLAPSNPTTDIRNARVSLENVEDRAGRRVRGVR